MNNLPNKIIIVSNLLVVMLEMSETYVLTLKCAVDCILYSFKSRGFYFGFYKRPGF